MTSEEHEKIVNGIHKWAEKAIEHDWVGQDNWWFRLTYWFNANFRHFYPGWYDDSEIASSIMSHIGLFDIKVEGDEIRFMTEKEIQNEDYLGIVGSMGDNSNSGDYTPQQ